MGSNIKKKYKATKYRGNDTQSWAVFYADDIRGLRSPVPGNCKATPIDTGLDMTEAKHLVTSLEKKWKEKNESS